MKQIYIFLLAALITNGATATTNIAKVNNGKWSETSTWSLNRVPQSHDTVLIPALVNVKMNNLETLSRLTLIVKGTLTFSNGKLRLDQFSRVIVELGGRITGGGSNDQIKIDESFVYKGSDADIIGFAIADFTTGDGFIGGLLPVQFLSFEASKKGNAVMITWTTANEVNNDYFEVQKSTDGRNWNVIGKVAAATATISVNQYQYQDRLPAASKTYYRIRQVDVNGKSSLTSVKIIDNDPLASATKIYKSGSQVVIEFTEAPTQSYAVQIINFNGQVVANYQMKKDVSRVALSLTASLKGNHIIRLVQPGAIQTHKMFL